MPQIDDAEAVFNPDTGEYELVFTGTEINGHFTGPESVDVFIGQEK
jgi:hypothetical protein